MKAMDKLRKISPYLSGHKPLYGILAASLVVSGLAVVAPTLKSGYEGLKQDICSPVYHAATSKVYDLLGALEISDNLLDRAQSEYLKGNSEKSRDLLKQNFSNQWGRIISHGMRVELIKNGVGQRPSEMFCFWGEFQTNLEGVFSYAMDRIHEQNKKVKRLEEQLTTGIYI